LKEALQGSRKTESSVSILAKPELRPEGIAEGGDKIPKKPKKKEDRSEKFGGPCRREGLQVEGKTTKAEWKSFVDKNFEEVLGRPKKIQGLRENLKKGPLRRKAEEKGNSLRETIKRPKEKKSEGIQKVEKRRVELAPEGNLSGSPEVQKKDKIQEKFRKGHRQNLKVGKEGPWDVSLGES